jgi:hypothetical protein
MVFSHRPNLLKCLATLFLFSSLALAETVPLQQDQWLVLPFSKIKPNQVSFADGKMKLSVQSSAGPVVYKLPEAKTITGFHLKGHYSGGKAVESGAFDEDSMLRFGVVAEGTQTLSGPKRWFAAAWVKKLFQLAPPGAGIDKIHFFGLTNRRDLLGKNRTHPKSDLMLESLVVHIEKSGDFDFSFQFKEPIRTVGLWLSADGDDTQSTFTTTLTSIELNK